MTVHLPLIKIYKESFYHVWRNKLSWLKVGFAPLVLFIMSELIALFSVFIPGIFGFGVLDTQLLLLFLSLLLINTIFSVIWGAGFYVNGYRYGILKEAGERWWHLPIDRRLFKMVGYSLFIGFIMGGSLPGAALLLNMVSDNRWVVYPVFCIFFLLLAHVMIRLSLVFPMISIDRDKPLRTSWHLLKGKNVRQLWRLFYLIGLTILGIILLVILFISLIRFCLGFLSPLLMAYMWALEQMVYGKLATLLASWTFIGIGTEGIVGAPITFMIGTALGFVDPLLIYVFSILMVLSTLPIVFFTWAVYTKALSLVYETLTQEEKENI